MKKLFSLVAVLLLAATVFAQSANPKKMNYQAVIRNAANELVTNTNNIKVVIDITDGTNNFSETHFANSNQNGLISLKIGEGGTDVVGSMDDIDWSNASIKTTINVPGEASPAISTTEITGVPLSFTSNYAQNVNPISVTNVIDTSTLVQNQIITVVNDTLMDGSSYLNHTVDTIALKTVLHYFDTTSSAQGTAAIEALAERVDVFNTHVCDSVAECLSNNINLQEAINSFLDSSSVYNQNFTDKVQNYIDSSVAYHNSLTEDIHNYIDSSEYFFNTINNIVDSSSSIINTLNNYVDSSSHIAGAITNYIDSSEHYVSTIITNIDTNKNVQSQIITVVNDTLMDGNSDLNHTIDTIALKTVLHYFDTTSSAQGTAAIEALAERVDEFNTHVCDSVAECLSNNINLQEAINSFLDSSSVYNQNFTDKVHNYIDSSEYFVNTINNIVDSSSSIINTLNNYVDSSSHIAGAITNYIDSSKHFVSTIITNIDTNKNVQSQIITVVNDTLMNGNSDLNHTVDTIALKTVVNYLDTTSSIPGADALEALAERVDEFNTHVCDSVAGCLGSNTTLQTAINNVTESYLATKDYITETTLESKNYLTSDSTVITNLLEEVKALKAATDTMKYAKFSATAAQTEFQVTVVSGSTINTGNRLVEFFINGVFVGTSAANDVVTVTGNKVTYNPAKNGNYALVAGDRIQIIYWVKKVSE